jgi:hypothetical protein
MPKRTTCGSTRVQQAREGTHLRKPVDAIDLRAEHHVVARRGGGRAVGRLDRDLGRGFAHDVQLDQALVGVERMSHAARTDQHDPTDVGAL